MQIIILCNNPNNTAFLLNCDKGYSVLNKIADSGDFPLIDHMMMGTMSYLVIKYL